MRGFRGRPMNHCERLLACMGLGGEYTYIVKGIPSVAMLRQKLASKEGADVGVECDDCCKNERCGHEVYVVVPDPGP